MFELRRNLFTRKVVEAIAPNIKNISDINPLDSIMIKIFILAYTIKTNHKLKYVNHNKICLYEICILAAYYVRWIYYSKNNLNFLKREEFDNEMISYLISGFDMFFKCPQIRENIEISTSRFEFFDEVLEKYIDNNNKNDFICVFEEFKIIIKGEIINKELLPFSANSPLYLLATFDENIKCEIECKEILQMISSHIFDDDILRLINDK